MKKYFVKIENYVYYRGSSFAGSIWGDYRNEADFQDQNTVLYGHNMLNGFMFGPLKHLDVDTRPKVINLYNVFYF